MTFISRRRRHPARITLWLQNSLQSSATTSSNTATDQFPVVDPETNAVYFLVSGEVFERFRGIFDADLDVTGTYAAQSAAAGQTGWDDPEMDVYDDYDAHKPQP